MYDEAGGEVPQETDQEVDGVDHGDRNNNNQQFVGFAKFELNKFSFEFFLNTGKI